VDFPLPLAPHIPINNIAIILSFGYYTMNRKKIPEI